MSDTPLSDEILKEGDDLMNSSPDWMREAEREFADESVQSGGGANNGFALSTACLVAVVVAMALA